jgi:murein DD-endopeptidase MepM/ murein hydrolase activator NlpD
MQEIISINNIENANKIRIGQTLKLTSDSSVKIKILDLALEPIEGLEFKLSYDNQTICYSTDRHGWLPPITASKHNTPIQVEVKKVTGEFKKVASIQSDVSAKIVTIKSPKMKFEAPLKKDETKKNPNLTTKAENIETPKKKVITHVYDKGKPIAKIQKEGKWMFPLINIPAQSYKDGARRFGANRNAERKHAGCDLYAPVGTKVYAMADGKIISYNEFYGKTWEIEVDHGDYIIRYGEVKPKPDGMALGLKVGSNIKQGQHIGYVGLVHFKSGGTAHMLHLEMYDKSGSGPLTNRANKPYQRRKGLVNPAPFLDQAKKNLPNGEI